MTRERAKELLPVIQAYAEGKTIQVRGILNETNWVNASDSDVAMIFETDSVQWRVKPEPREGWIPACAICISAECAEILARNMLGSHLASTSEIIHVREVVD